MPPSRPLQVAAAVAGAGALVGAGVALGRGLRREDTAPSLWPESLLTLRFGSLDIRRRAPGSYVVRVGDSSWTLSRDVKGAFRVGTVTLKPGEWRVITAMLEAAWSLLEVVPEGRSVHDLRLALTELPLESQWSLQIDRPIELLRDVSSREFYVVHKTKASESVAHLPIWARDHAKIVGGGFDLTRRQWILYTGILEAAWLVGETMDGSIGGGSKDEGKG